MINISGLHITFSKGLLVVFFMLIVTTNFFCYTPLAVDMLQIVLLDSHLVRLKVLPQGFPGPSHSLVALFALMAVHRRHYGPRNPCLQVDNVTVLGLHVFADVVNGCAVEGGAIFKYRKWFLR